MATKSSDLYEMEKTMWGGFLGPVKIESSLLGRLLLEGSNVKKGDLKK